MEIRFFDSGCRNASNRGVVKAITHRGASGVMDGGPQTYRILKFVAGSFGKNSVLLPEGSILDPCYEMWE
jgi:hypothetical protein